MQNERNRPGATDLAVLKGHDFSRAADLAALKGHDFSRAANATK
jgi:hypothetical protein